MSSVSLFRRRAGSLVLVSLLSVSVATLVPVVNTAHVDASGIQAVYNLGNTYVDTTTAGGDWYLLGYGEYGNMGRLDSSSGSFNAGTRTGKATLDSVAFVRGATHLAISWTTSGGSLPTGGIGSYDHAISFPLTNAANMTLTGAASQPTAGNTSSDFSRNGTNAGQSLVTLTSLVGSFGLPAQMYMRNITLGVNYGSAYGLANNPGINNQLDWGPDGQAFSAVYVQHNNSNGYVTPSGTSQGYTPRTMAIWAKHPGSTPPVCSPTTSTNGLRTVVRFTSVGQCTWSVPANITSADVLLVGGGGGGGGGAGGYKYATSESIAGDISVVVGTGGAGTLSNGSTVGNQGTGSSFGALSVVGGGAGGNYLYLGTAGGSGGGNGQDRIDSVRAGTASQGNAGGTSNCDWYGGGGGGGGAGAAGTNGGPSVNTPLSGCSSRGLAGQNPTAGGNGGDGLANTITGSSVYYAGGGGGGVNTNAGPINSGGLGGQGGGGDGARCDQCHGTNGVDGRGGGGGGGDAEGRGGDGGDGVVIISYVTYVPTTTTTTTTSTTTTTVVAPSTSVAPATNPGGSGSTNNGQGSGSGLGSGSTNTTAVSTTTTTTTSLPEQAEPRELTVDAPESPEVETGGAALVLDGEAASLSLTRENNRVRITGAGMLIVLSIVDENDTQRALDDSGSLRLIEGDKIIVEGEGFDPDTEVGVWLLSEPRQLGVVTTDSAGKVAGLFTQPADTPTGEHRLVVSGVLPDGKSAVLAVSVAVGRESSGSAVARTAILVPLLLAVLVGLFLPTVLRRRRSVGASD